MPANANAVKAGNAYVSLSMKNDLEKGLRKAQARLRAFGSALQRVGKQFLAVGSAGLGVFLAAAKKFANFGDDIAKMSKRTGIGVQSLSRLAYAAEISGTNIEAVEKGVARMQRNIVEAGQGSATAQRALNTLGITLADLSDLSPEQQFAMIAGRLAEMENPTLKAATAMQLFGRSGAELLPLINEGAEGLQKLFANSDRLGATLSPQDAKLAEELTDAWTDLRIAFRGIFLIVGSAVAPVLKQVASIIADNLVAIRKWVAEHKKLISIVMIAFSAIAGIGIALITLGVVAKIAAFAIGLMGTALKVLTVIAKVAKLAFVALKVTFSLLTNPVGLVIVALVALAAVFIYVSGIGTKVVNWLKQKWAELAEFFSKTMTGMGQALAAGDLALAANILWASLKLAWVKGSNYVQGIWDGLMHGLTSTFSAVWTGILAIGEYVWHGLVVGWIETVSALKKGWAEFKSWFTGDDSAVASIEADRQSQRDRARQTHEATLAAIGQGDLDRQEQLKKQRAEAEEQAAAELQAARSEWQGLLDKAATLSDDTLESETGPDFDGLFDSIAEGQGATVKGTFSARAASLFGSGDTIQKKQLNVLEQIAENTEDIDGLAFG